MAGLPKKVIVIDIGSCYTKLGVSGDAHPRCIIPTCIRDPVTGTIKNVFNYKKQEELYNNLVEFLHYIYFKKILISPKDTKVIIVDSLLSSLQVKDTLAKVLFCHLQIASLLMVPSHMVSLYTLAADTALVFDIGYQEACLIPVYEGYPVLHAYEAQPIAGKAVETKLKALLIDYYKQNYPDKLKTIENLSETTIEDIKVRLCFVTTLQRSLALQEGKDVTPPPSVEYNIAGTDIMTIDGKIRETACEVLFEMDADEISLTTMILNALLKCPLDMRKPLAENIILIGGTSSIPGIKSRILNELKYYVETPKYKNRLFINNFKMHSSPAQENYISWLGASLVGVTEMVNLHSITQDDYKKERVVPDWANLKYNTKQIGTTAK